MPGGEMAGGEFDATGVAGRSAAEPEPCWAEGAWEDDWPPGALAGRDPDDGDLGVPAGEAPPAWLTQALADDPWYPGIPGPEDEWEGEAWIDRSPPAVGGEQGWGVRPPEEPVSGAPTGPDGKVVPWSASPESSPEPEPEPGPAPGVSPLSFGPVGSDSVPLWSHADGVVGAEAAPPWLAAAGGPESARGWSDGAGVAGPEAAPPWSAAGARPVPVQEWSPQGSPASGPADSLAGRTDPFAGGGDCYAGRADSFAAGVDPYAGRTDPFAGGGDPLAGGAIASGRRPRRQPGRPQVLMWACPKGGSGKTSLSLRYAAQLATVGAGAGAGAGRRVVWLDGNLQQADGARYLGADERGAPTILDLAAREEPSERDVLAALTPPQQTGWPTWALFGPALKADADPRLVTPALYRLVVHRLRQHFDHIVVDTPVAEHHNRFFVEFVLPEADQLVVVVPPLLPVVRAVREWLELQCAPVAAGGSSLPASSVRIVLNMASDASGCSVEAVRDAWLARWTWAGAVPHDPAWTAVTNNGGLNGDDRTLAAGFADLLRATTGDVVDHGGGGRLRSRWWARLAGTRPRRVGRL